MRVHANIPIGEIAASMPHVTKLLDLLGVDYVLHGNLTLRDACAEAGVDPAIVRKSIESLPQPADARPGWCDVSAQELIEELRDRRHPKMREMLADTAELLAEAQPGDPGLGALRDAFSALCEELQPHMTKEEHMLFPVIQHLEDCWTRSETPGMNFVGGIAKPMAHLFEDHVQIMERLRQVHDAAAVISGEQRELTRLVDAIADLEHEIREHVHLENNVLYPRAAAIETAVKV